MNIPVNVTELRHRLQVQKRYIADESIKIDKAKADVAVMEAQLLDLFPPTQVAASEPGEVDSRSGSFGLTGEAAADKTALKADQYEHDMATGDSTAIGGVKTERAPGIGEMSDAEAKAKFPNTAIGKPDSDPLPSSGAGPSAKDGAANTPVVSGATPLQDANIQADAAHAAKDEAKPDPSNAAEAMAKATQPDPAQS